MTPLPKVKAIMTSCYTQAMLTWPKDLRNNCYVIHFDIFSNKYNTGGLWKNLSKTKLNGNDVQHTGYTWVKRWCRGFAMSFDSHNFFLLHYEPRKRAEQIETLIAITDPVFFFKLPLFRRSVFLNWFENDFKHFSNVFDELKVWFS